jgi:hypothetical protein
MSPWLSHDMRYGVAVMDDKEDMLLLMAAVSDCLDVVLLTLLDL